MGSLASGIAGLVMGDPTKQQENQLGDLGTFSSTAGESGVKAGQGYDLGILSGDPSQIAMTLAPEIKANQDQATQQKDTIAQFGGRSGGNTATANNIDTASRGNIIDLIGREREGAAAREEGLGTNLLGQATGDITTEAGLKRDQNTAELGDIGGIATGAAQIAAAPFTGGASLGMGDFNLPGVSGIDTTASSVGMGDYVPQ